MGSVILGMMSRVAFFQSKKVGKMTVLAEKSLLKTGRGVSG